MVPALVGRRLAALAAVQPHATFLGAGLGRLHHDVGGTRDELSRLQRVAEVGFPFEAAYARLDGDVAAARAALAQFESMGAKPAAGEALGRLRAMGARGIPRGPRASTATNPDGLTASEQEILALLSEDLTKRDIAARLFLSEKTVDHHVSAILGKLGVRSRAQAARRTVHVPAEDAGTVAARPG